MDFFECCSKQHAYRKKKNEIGNRKPQCLAVHGIIIILWSRGPQRPGICKLYTHATRPTATAAAIPDVSEVYTLLMLSYFRSSGNRGSAITILFSILIKPRRRRPAHANWPSSLAFPESVARRHPRSIIKINWPKYIGNNMPCTPRGLVSLRSLRVLVRSPTAKACGAEVKPKWCRVTTVGRLFAFTIPSYTHRAHCRHTRTHTRVNVPLLDGQNV